MRFQILTTALALSSTMCGVFAAPSPAGPAEVQAVEKRASSLSAAAALSIVQGLTTTLNGMATNINKTTSSISDSSTAAQKSAAVSSVGAEMTSMTLAINKAVGEIGLQANGVSQTARSLEGRQSAEALAVALEELLFTLAGTVNTALAVLGLTGLLAFLTPLTGSLSGLVLTLIGVVDGLLAVVEVLLNGLLIGVSGLLAGLIL